MPEIKIGGAFSRVNDTIAAAKAAAGNAQASAQASVAFVSEFLRNAGRDDKFIDAAPTHPPRCPASVSYDSAYLFTMRT